MTRRNARHEYGKLPLPSGEGRGEGLRTLGRRRGCHIDGSYPLTLSLSEGERSSFAVKARDRERGPEALTVHVAGDVILAAKR
jgi:hypothetical protein